MMIIIIIIIMMMMMMMMMIIIIIIIIISSGKVLSPKTYGPISHLQLAGWVTRYTSNFEIHTMSHLAYTQRSYSIALLCTPYAFASMVYLN